MQHLANVELQLVMHGLDVKSLLQFARCSSQTLRLADTRFAWKFTVRRVTCPTDDPPLPPTSLLRHAPVALRLVWPQADRFQGVKRPALFVSQCFALASLAQVRKLHLTPDAPMCNALIRQILAHPTMQHLRVLWLHTDFQDHGPAAESESDAHLLASLPRLHTLSVRTGLSGATRWTLLPAAPALATLHIVNGSTSVDGQRVDDGCARIGDAGLRYLNSCGRITQLSVAGSALYEGAFRGLFASPCMQRLRTLKLVNFCARHPPHQPLVVAATAEDYAASFAALTHLHTLTLLGCLELEELLPHVVLAPALRSLVIEVPTIAVEITRLSLVPPPASLVSQVLALAPQLSVRLLLQNFKLHTSLRLSYASGLDPAVAARFSMRFTQPAADPTARLSID